MSILTKYGIYFNKNGTTTRLPVNPEQFVVEYPTENTRYNVLDLGEIIVPRIPKLQQISWGSFFPGKPEPYVLTSSNFKTPEFYINLFSDYEQAREPVRFIANRYMEDGSMIFDTNMEVIIEDFKYEEKGGETGDFYYEIKLSQYKSYAPQTVSISLPKVSAAPAVAVATPQRAAAPDVINVGDTVIANGSFWYSSWGAKPFGTANNKQIQVARIIQNPTSGQDYPVLIGVLGWVKMSQLKKV